MPKFIQKLTYCRRWAKKPVLLRFFGKIFFSKITYEYFHARKRAIDFSHKNTPYRWFKKKFWQFFTKKRKSTAFLACERVWKTKQGKKSDHSLVWKRKWVNIKKIWRRALGALFWRGCYFREIMVYKFFDGGLIFSEVKWF